MARTRGRPLGGSTPTPETTMTSEQVEALITQRVEAALARQSSGRGNSSQGDSSGGPRVCSYKDFMGCKPTTFNGKGGVVALTRWIEKVESVFDISSCIEANKVKFAAGTFLETALSWWNSHIKTVTLEVANTTPWEDFKAMMVEEYCPREQVQKMENEFWSHKMQGSNITTYTDRFNDLAMFCQGMVNPEYRRIERYIWGLAPEIQGLVTAARPATFDSAKRLAHQLVEQMVQQGTITKKADTSRGDEGGHKRKSGGKSTTNNTPTKSNKRSLPLLQPQQWSLPPRSLTRELFPSVTNARSITWAPAENYTAATAKRRVTLSVIARYQQQHQQHQQPTLESAEPVLAVAK